MRRVPPELATLTGLTYLRLANNTISSVPTELAALTGLVELHLDFNQLTGVPAEFRTVNPTYRCYLYDNPGFSCANVGAGTSCCTSGNCGNVGTCFQG